MTTTTTEKTAAITAAAEAVIIKTNFLKKTGIFVGENMEFDVRRAQTCDLDAIKLLLKQVLEIHHKGRPDIFRGGCRKYTDEELTGLISDDSCPIFVAVDNNEKVVGYCFCVFKQQLDSHILTDIKTLYIDDLCVDENARSQGIGKLIFNYVKSFAKEQGCYNLTLNVWACNESALKFYQKMGLEVQKQEMEALL